MKSANKKISLILLIIILLQTIFPIIGEFKNWEVHAAGENVVEEDTEYKELKNLLESILKKKNFSEEVNEKLRSCLEQMWKNYDELYEIYSIIGYPEKKKYICDNFIYVIRDKIEKIEVLDRNNKNDRKYAIEKYGYTEKDIDYNGGMNISGTIIIWKDLLYDYYNYFKEYVLVHEIYHSKGISAYYGSHQEFLVLLEGGATWASDVFKNENYDTANFANGGGRPFFRR